MAELIGEDRRRSNHTIRWITVLGQLFAFIVVMTALALGYLLIHEGKDAAGIAAILTAIAVPLGVFAYNNWSKKH